MNKQIVYIGVSFLLFAVLKYLFSVASVEQLQFLLLPLNRMLEAFSGHQAVYQQGVGYVYPDQWIVIGKSCAGATFFLICFLTYSYQLIRNGTYNYPFMIPVVLLGSWLLTLFANVSRVTLYMLLMQSGILSRFHHDIMHMGVGMVVYVMYLCLIYYILQLTVFKFKSYEEVA